MTAAPPIFACLLLFASPAIAQAADEADDDDRPVAQTDIVVTARRLDAARTAIEPDLGASSYTLTNDAVENRQGGETGNLDSILVQMPGVRRSGSGALVVRGSPGGVQYRLNNIILPEGTADFGEMLSARLADSTKLVTGALPAQYGLASGGVVNITTKSGLYEPGGQVEFYGGTRHMVEPAFEWGAASGRSSLFVSGSLRRGRLGFPSLDGSAPRPGDRSRELEGFAFADRLLDSSSRLSLILGTSNERKRIAGRKVAGIAAAERAHGDQSTSGHYAILSYLKTDPGLSLQASLFGLLAREAITPDEPASLAVDAVSRRLRGNRRASGIQLEAAQPLGQAHMLRYGLLVALDREEERERSRTPAIVYLAAATEHRTAASAFVQDEWTLGPALTANAGLRLDRVWDVDASVHFSPRANLVWKPAAGLVAHLGYAHYYVPPPLGDAAPRSAFTGGPAETRRPRAETDDYFDLGAQQQLGAMTLGVDGYWQIADNLLARRNWDYSPISRPFNFATGKRAGIELSMTYAKGPLSGWSNLALGYARGRRIVTDLAEFTPAQLAFAAGHDVPLDEDQRITGSGGLSYRLGRLLLAGDMLVGSGAARTSPGGRLNGAHLPAYATVDASLSYRLKGVAERPLAVRLDIANLFDRRYALRDGSALGGGAPQWGDRRALAVGFEQSF